jgi:hypothetical protein
MQCFRCDEPAVQECQRCGHVYCEDHGEVLCQQCMDPATALPPSRIYRGSMLALLIGAVFAIWLLLDGGVVTDAGADPPGVVHGATSDVVTPSAEGGGR